MTEKTITHDEVIQLAIQLPWRERLRLIRQILAELDEQLPLTDKGSEPLRSLYGLWQDYSIELTEQDIAQARREMWGRFAEREL